MTQRDCLIEIGTEELPAKSLERLSADFQNHVAKELTDKQLRYKSITAYVTPRRLALVISKLAEQQPNQLIEKKGPQCNGPEEIGLAFAKACGVPFSKLKKQDGRFVYEYTKIGQATIKLLPEILGAAVKALHLEKRMRWAELQESFLRPVKWLVVLYGKQTVPVRLWEITASNYTYGHRFHAPQKLRITSPNQYEKILKTKGYVIPSLEERQAMIVKQLKKAGANDYSPLLLKEVTGLVEWPVTLKCDFEPRFLALPQEVLIAAMQDHQRCFPLRDKQGNLLPHFLVVTNLKSTKPKLIITGNERVMRARLSDAEFFFNKDNQEKLSDRIEALKGVIFQQELGNLYDKVLRVKQVSEWLASKINAPRDVVLRAAELAKADLTTAMVGEFPELQGLMGYYYAKKSGELDAVAVAIREHYQPRFANDALPESLPGSVIAIADRIDSLVGLFAIGKAPTADKDPFGLRRAAQGALRIIVEKSLDVDLKELIAKAAEAYKRAVPFDAIYQFMMERLRFLNQEKGILVTVLNAVIAKNPTHPFDFQKRLEAVNEFIRLEEAEALIAANKRVSNILRKESVQNGMVLNAELLKAPAELALAKKLKEHSKEANRHYQQKNYTAALKVLANLREPVDRFFDEVLVMAEEKAVRENRLALLMQLRSAFTEVADISLL